MPSLVVPLVVMGIEVEVEVDFDITSSGSPGGAMTSWGFDPPESPEFEITGIVGQLTGVSFDSLFQDPEAMAKIDAYLCEHAEFDDGDPFDYDYGE
jgi:hypothetical protein